MDNQQEGEKEDRNNKGVRRPRSDGARRPRPASGLPSAPSADDIIASSHPSHDSHKELHSEDLSGVHDRTAERRLGARHSEVMEVGESRLEETGEKKEYRKEDKFYSRHGTKEHHSNPSRHFGTVGRSSGEGYDGERRGGGREEYRGGRGGRGTGNFRPHDSRSSREERGPLFAGSGVQGNGRDSGRRVGDRREEGRMGREDERVGKHEGGRFGPRRDDHRDSYYSARRDHSGDRRYQGKDESKQERGEQRESGVTRRPEYEKGKRLEKSMKDIVDIEMSVTGHREDRHEAGHNHEKAKAGRWREREDHDNGKEKSQHGFNQTERATVRDKHGPKEANLKSLEKEHPEQKAGGFTKLKLKVGGVTHTIVSDSLKRSDSAVKSGSTATNKPKEPEVEGTNKKRRHRLILQEHSDDDDDTMDAPPPSKAIKKTESFSPGHKGDAEPRIANGEKSRSAVRSGEYSKVSTLAVESSTPSVRKSSRVPKKRVLDGDEDDAEPPNVPQRPSGHKRGGWGVEEEEEQKEEQDADEYSEEAGATLGEDGSEGDEDEDQGLGVSKRGKLQQLRAVQNKENTATGVALTARQRAMQTSRDPDKESAPSLIEYPEGLTNPLARKGRNNLSEAERQVKKVEAAHRRKQQVEKAAREIQATAIQKILGQDSTRKRRENRLEKQRQDIEEEKKAAELAPSSNSIRWNFGPSGTVVSFAEDVGLPSFFNSGPSRYPPAREKCAAPACSNSYKYRDSKSNVPLCSLQCYQVVHHPLPVTTTY